MYASRNIMDHLGQQSYMKEGKLQGQDGGVLTRAGMRCQLPAASHSSTRPKSASGRSSEGVFRLGTCCLVARGISLT